MEATRENLKLVVELWEAFNELSYSGKLEVVEAVKGKYPQVATALEQIAERGKE